MAEAKTSSSCLVFTAQVRVGNGFLEYLGFDWCVFPVSGAMVAVVSKAPWLQRAADALGAAGGPSERTEVGRTRL